MKSEELLNHITESYLNSNDEFNGVFAPSAGTLGLDSNVGPIRELVEAGKLYVNYGDRHPNPHILAFAPEPLAEQIAKLESGTEISGCLYPTPAHLEAVVDRATYDGRPYTLELALGQPQLGYHYFDLSVLETYRNDPRYYYRFDITGMISIRDEHYQSTSMDERDQVLMESLGLAIARQKVWGVVAFLRYLHQLSPEHQQMWRAKQEPNRDEYAPHPDYWRASMGEWPEKLSIFEATLLEMAEVNKVAGAIGRPVFFRQIYEGNDRPRDFGYLIRPTAREFSNFAQLLDKMLGDNINRDFFQHEVAYEDETPDKKGRIVVTQRGTIRIFEEWVTKMYRPKGEDSKKLIDQIFATLKQVRKLRNPTSHAVGLDRYNVELFEEQSALMREVYIAVRSIRQMLQGHPQAHDYQVSRVLDMEVWPA